MKAKKIANDVIQKAFFGGQVASAAKLYAINEHRGSPRLWLQGLAPQRAGFVPGCKFTVRLTESKSKGVVIELAADGDRTVSKKEYASGTEVPVIDINSRDDLAAVCGHKVVRAVFSPGRVVISPLASEQRRVARMARVRRKLQTGQPLTTAGICAGGGVLSHAVHAGLQEAGVPATMAMFNEVRDDLAEQAMRHNDVVTEDTRVMQLPLQELAFDEELLAEVGPVDVLELGLPCSGASLAGRARRGLAMPEEHPLVGHLVAGALALVAKLNPIVCVFENVVQYAATASAHILRGQLRDLGYETHEIELYGPDFGDLEARRRWCMVAMTRGVPFSFDRLKKPELAPRRLSDVLEPPDHPGLRWDTMQGLKDKMEADKAKGNNFKMQVFTGEESTISTLTAGIAKNRSTDAKIQHPENPDLLRVPTAREHARFKGVPEHLIEGLSHTVGNQMLGQSITYRKFVAVHCLVGNDLRAWANGREDTSHVSAPALLVAA